MAFNESYKRWHTPKRNNFNEDGTLKKGESYQGYYKITNRDKYVGNPDLIIFRSSWEFSFCKWCDYSPSIIRWGSEPVRIPYYDKVSKLAKCKELGIDPNNPKNWVTKFYTTDFWIQVKKADGSIEKWFVEIKPGGKLHKPVPPDRNAPLAQIKRYNRLVREYLVNEEKFKAIEEWANKNGTKFYIFTESELLHFGIIGGRFDIKKEDLIYASSAGRK